MVNDNGAMTTLPQISMNMDLIGAKKNEGDKIGHPMVGGVPNGS